MSTSLVKHLCIDLTACGAILAGALPLHAGTSHDYPKTGTVLSVTTDQGVVYKIDTGDEIYKMECIKSRMFQATPPQCAISERPIAVNDRVHFRLDEDEDETATAYMPASGNREEKLLVLSSELKVLPQLPATTNPSARESCTVRAIGTEVIAWRYLTGESSPPAFGSGTTASGASSITSSTSPVIPAGPVTAIPVTGGPPVQVIATGPVSGGVITGVSATGGAPVTAIAVGPVTGIPMGNTMPETRGDLGTAFPAGKGTSVGFAGIIAPVWASFLRVQTAEHVYKLACESKPCWLKDQAPQLGDLLTIRIKEKAYLSWLPPGPKGEQKFAILSMDDMNEPAATPAH